MIYNTHARIQTFMEYGVRAAQGEQGDRFFYFRPFYLYFFLFFFSFLAAWLHLPIVRARCLERARPPMAYYECYKSVFE